MAAGRELDTTPPKLPRYWELLWLLFMQPITLHHRLRACGIDPDASAWRLWRQQGPDEGNRRVYVQRMLLLIVTAPPFLILLFIIPLWLAGIPVDLLDAAVGVAGGVALGVALGMAQGVAVGVAGGVTLGVAVVVGVAGGVAGGVALGVAWGVALGMAQGVAVGVALGVALGMAQGVALSMVVGVAWGVAGGVAGGVAIQLFLFRVPLYPFEVILQAVLYGLELTTGRSLLCYAPVLFHDLSYLPHPFLHRHIVLAAARDPALAREVLTACAVAPGQRRIGQAALAELQARELSELGMAHRFGAVVALEGEWLPGLEGADSLLLAFSDLARYLQAADKALVPYHRLQHLDNAEKKLAALENQRLQTHSPLAHVLKATLGTWRGVLRGMHERAQQAAAGTLPNPFRAGQPLSPEQGMEVFRGREDLVRQVELLLSDPSQSVSIALIGPRRCGKTSLLKMLPVKLPDAVCVFFDLQDNPVESTTSFFQALARQAREQARRHRQGDLPLLSEGPPFEAASRWFQQLEESEGERRILICIDEFERLENLFPGNQQDLQRLMGLLRATVQHRRKLRLLVSGAATFEEWDALWNDHFINVREVSIGYLDRESALGLLMRPSPDFPDDTIPQLVAEAIFARTGGQPYLVQLYGSLLVTRLNEHRRQAAILGDVAAVEEEVLDQAAYYFRDTYYGAPKGFRNALDAMARGQTSELDHRTRRWLRRRYLLAEDNQLWVPVLGRWIREELGD